MSEPTRPHNEQKHDDSELKLSRDLPHHSLHYRQQEHDNDQGTSIENDELHRVSSFQPEMAPMALDEIMDDIGPAPDGGLKAWLCILGAFCSCFCVFGFYTSFGQLQVYYLGHQLADSSRADIGWISSVAVLLVYIGSIFSGRYFDSHGTTRLLISGTVVYVGSLIGIAFSQKYWQFFLAHAGTGIGGTLMYAPSTSVSVHWFMKKRSTAVGIVNCGSGLGGIIYPIMIKRLVDMLGFRNGILVIAGMNTALLTVSCVTMKSRLPPRTPPPWRNLLSPWRDLRYVFLLCGTAIITLGWAAPYFNAAAFARTNPTNSTVGGYAVAILQTGSFLGRVSAGVLADRLGVWKVSGTVAVLSTIVLASLWTPSPHLPNGAVVFGLLAYGYTSGAWTALIPACCATVSPVKEQGMRMGMIWTACAVPALIGPVICGALVSVDHGLFTYAAIFCAVVYSLGMGISVAPVWTRRSSSRSGSSKGAGREANDI